MDKYLIAGLASSLVALPVSAQQVIEGRQFLVGPYGPYPIADNIVMVFPCVSQSDCESITKKINLFIEAGSKTSRNVISQPGFGNDTIAVGNLSMLLVLLSSLEEIAKTRKSIGAYTGYSGHFRFTCPKSRCVLYSFHTSDPYIYHWLVVSKGGYIELVPSNSSRHWVGYKKL